MKFTLSISADNAAFHDDDCTGTSARWTSLCECFAMRLEISVILREVAKRIEADGMSGFHENIRDSNGNIVGTYAIKADNNG